ncbi:MAG TPA: barstar family protein [Myxococcaceae bacterium]|nr:barstar family protein [Myxococcaceae bacterium]
MAAFRDDEVDRLDYELLRDGPVTKYFRPEVLERDLHWLRERGYVISSFDATGWASGADPLREIARELQFPQHFAGNLDALHECLSELSIPDDSGRAIVIRRFEALYGQDPGFAWNLLDVFAAESRNHLLRGRRLMVLVQTDDPRLSIRAVGECPVGWNLREWTDKARGV